MNHDGSADWIALDIGGANLKLADGRGLAVSYGFALWKDFRRLEHELRSIITESSAGSHLAVTMTGELADCFAGKSQGVQYILEAIQAAADGRHIRVYLSDGSLVAPAVAMKVPQKAASSNWHVLARFSGRYVPHGSALLIDVGSTTCDVVPLIDGQPAAHGATDNARLMSRELVYTGVERSPLCALIRDTPYRGGRCPVAHEVFATMQDAYLTVGRFAESSLSTHTADGGPSTRAAARLRLSRMISAEDAEFLDADARQMAEAAIEMQERLLADAVQQVAKRLNKPPTHYVVSGHGEFLARRVLERLKATGEVISLTEKLGPEISRSATAHALAVVAAGK